jgi:general secretion pathway protein K
MKALKSKRGVVLILVLSMVALFSAMIVNFSSDEALDIELAYNFRDSIQAQYIAMAGVEAAKVILSQDNAGYDSLDEQWADFPVFAASASTYLEGGQLTGTITDECSKFDLNSLAINNDNHRSWRELQFKRLFTVLNIDITPEELDDLTNSIIDWESAASEVSIVGAKDEYYQSLEPPYHCKNGPMDSIEEIMLVRGMKKEYFFGTENYEGIRNYITVSLNTSTCGKININTASETVLRSIDDRFTEDVVNNIVADRPFKNISDVSGIRGLDLTDTEGSWIKSNILAIKSQRFSVDVTGKMPSGALINVNAILERISNNPRIVYYRIY